VQTEVELDSGQSFVIAGLLDNQTSETLSKVPGIGSVPVLGKLFQSKNISRSNSELMVIITPEVVRPIPAGQPAPELKFPAKFISGGDTTAPANPGLDKTGPVPVKPPFETLPVEELMPKQGQSTTPAPAMYQMVPVMPVAPGPNANSSPGISSPAAAAIPAPASAPPGGGNK
jgi:pilus assembly protein CpaC